MIRLSETKQYNIAPAKMITDSFNSSYAKYASAQEAAPPDTATMICSMVSMAMLIAMFVLTAVRNPAEQAVWIAMSVAVVAAVGLILYRYFKARAEYLKAAGKPDLVSSKREEYAALFGNVREMPEEMLAGDFQDQVRRLRDREQDNVRKNALKEVFDGLTAVNNPDLPVCRLVTPLPELFSQPRTRLYMKKSGNTFIFYDFNWSAPQGQIECDEDDIVSYGRFSQYPASVNTSGGKIRPESGIVELNGENGPVYVDFIEDEFEKALKLLPRRKEKK